MSRGCGESPNLVSTSSSFPCGLRREANSFRDRPAPRLDRRRSTPAYQAFVVAKQDFGPHTQVHGTSRGPIEVIPAVGVRLTNEVGPFAEGVKSVCLAEQAGSSGPDPVRIHSQPRQHRSRTQPLKPALVLVELPT